MSQSCSTCKYQRHLINQQIYWCAKNNAGFFYQNDNNCEDYEEIKYDIKTYVGKEE